MNKDAFDFSNDLLLLYFLKRRMHLLAKDELQYKHLLRGAHGEYIFRQYFVINRFPAILPLFDFSYEIDGKEFQIDALLITRDTIYMIEVKHFSGDYFLQNEQFFHLKTRNQIQNPLLQSERARFLFTKFLKQLGIKNKVENYIVFTNPSFILYDSPSHLPFIFAGQIDRFLQRLNVNARSTNEQQRHIAARIQACHMDSSRYERRPSYETTDLKQGVFCLRCSGNMSRKKRFYVYCEVCETFIHIEEATLLAIAEFQFLFPNEKITAKQIFEWSGGIVSWRYIRRLLEQHLIRVPKGKYTYFYHRNKSEYRDRLERAFYTFFLKQVVQRESSLI